MKEFDVCMLAVYIAISIVNLVKSWEAVMLLCLLVFPELGFQGKSLCTCYLVCYFVNAFVRFLIYLSLMVV